MRNIKMENSVVKRFKRKRAGLEAGVEPGLLYGTGTSSVVRTQVVPFIRVLGSTF